ncbi:hypothetical protein KJ657_05405 [Patescibacteria group bacterium]|nr:hypothetical protein [Patescibacteria group bacterium]MBU1016494.1 hypothetical protein [Patescibacteria group bacterium]MBU1685127.1 hypothetical protein [Patescibacteria group bacterium]MBU1938627.1 hypothetical protein [Patescibacteria group bacterium]
MIKEIWHSIIGTAYAQNLIPCEDGTMADPTVGCTETPKAIVSTQSEILSIILKTADSVVTVAVAASVIVLIYGGIVYAISMGNEDRIKTAKNIIFWSTFGLIVTLLAKYIVTAVLVIITQ